MPAINGRSGLIHFLRAVTAATVMAPCATLLPAVSAWQPATKAGIVLALDEERLTAAAPSAAQAPQPPKPEARDDGMGQGRNSLHLARLGWEVTGVSAVGRAPLGYAANELLTTFAALRVRRYEDTRAPADWGGAATRCRSCASSAKSAERRQRNAALSARSAATSRSSSSRVL
jgi:hypothetical protein